MFPTGKSHIGGKSITEMPLYAISSVFFAGLAFFSSFQIIFQSRELIIQLFRRDYFAVYKKAFAGVLWVLAGPVIGIASWVFLNAVKILQPGDVGIPYPAYVLAGSLMWGFFMGIYRSTAVMLEVYRFMIMNVKVHFEILFAVQILSAAADFILAFIVSLVVLAVYGVWPSWGIVLFPLCALPLFLFASSFGLVVAMISIVSYDINRIFSGLMGLTLFVTPVIYAQKAVGHPLLMSVIRYNPLTYLVCTCRDMVLFGRILHPSGFFLSSVLSLLMFLFAWRLFKRAGPRLVERMF
jgi:lipopolysaccharide transport system permease protein